MSSRDGLVAEEEGVPLMAHSASTAEATLPPLVSGPYRKRIGLISIIACFGGLLFGYDTGVSNGAERPMQAELGLSDLAVGVVISSLIFAAAVGALVGGQISDAGGVGRRSSCSRCCSSPARCSSCSRRASGSW
jgi:major inositol transporter-like SP family MFS transporter